MKNTHNIKKMNNTKNSELKCIKFTGKKGMEVQTLIAITLAVLTLIVVVILILTGVTPSIFGMFD